MHPCISRVLLPGALAAGLAVSPGCGLGRVESDGDQGRDRDAVRSLTLDLAAPAEGTLRFENLVGRFSVVPGDDDQIRVMATVHGGSAELADSIRLDRLEGDDGETTIRVAYPTDRHSTFRYGDRESDDSGWLDLLGAEDRSTGMEYGGERVRVSNGHGAPLYTDLEIRLPSSGVRAVFYNMVGTLQAREVRGELGFEAGTGDLRLESVEGAVQASLFSGRLQVAGLDGSLKCETATGEISIREFSGESIECSTASGNIELEEASGGSIKASTASGNISLRGAATLSVAAGTASGDILVEGGPISEFKASSASGDITMVSESPDLEIVEAESVGGSVTLTLSDELSFEVRTEAGEERMDMQYADAEPIREGSRIVGYRRGAGGARIEISTVHGELSVAPARRAGDD